MSSVSVNNITGLSRRWERPIVFLGLLVAGMLATLSGLGSISGSKTAVVLPIALGIGLVLAIIGLTRFQVYVMIMLVVRSSLDLAKVSGNTAGTTDVTVTSRADDPSSLLAVLFLVLGAVWLIGQYRAGERMQPSGLRKALIAFWLAGVLSIVASQRASASAIDSLRIGAIVVMFMVLERMMRDEALMRKMLAATMASMIFPLLFTTFGFLIGHPHTETKGSFVRITGTFLQCNDYGRYLMLMIIMSVALYPHVSRPVRQWLVVAMILMVPFEFLTYTRSALVGCVIGLMIVGAKQSKRVLGAMVVAIVLALLLVPALAGRFTDLSQTSGHVSAAQLQVSNGNSLSWRLSYWGEVLPLANSNPVTGIGLYVTQYITDQAKQPHNDFIRAYVETGVIGFVSYTAAMWLLILLGRRATRASPPGTFDYGVSVGYYGCAVAFVACSLVSNAISNVVNLWYFVAFAAAASSALYRHSSAGPIGGQPAVIADGPRQLPM
jgi:putative inorganic carbon (hco3(-)) transporter